MDNPEYIDYDKLVVEVYAIQLANKAKIDSMFAFLRAFTKIVIGDNQEAGALWKTFELLLKEEVQKVMENNLISNAQLVNRVKEQLKDIPGIDFSSLSFE